jgi:hypothetical protein
MRNCMVCTGYWRVIGWTERQLDMWDKRTWIDCTGTEMWWVWNQRELERLYKKSCIVCSFYWQLLGLRWEIVWQNGQGKLHGFYFLPNCGLWWNVRGWENLDQETLYGVCKWLNDFVVELLVSWMNGAKQTRCRNKISHCAALRKCANDARSNIMLFQNVTFTYLARGRERELRERRSVTTVMMCTETKHIDNLFTNTKQHKT